MPVSPRILKKHGCTPRDWKPLFAPKDPSEKLPAIKKLEVLIMNRINDGRLRNFEDYRTYAAIDLAYDAPFNQTTPTILQSLMGRNYKKPEDVLSALEQWGLKPEELFLKQEVNGRMVWKPNYPTFYKILVPLVKSYVTIRLAKLFNDRNQSPLFKYEPLQSNTENRILCDIVTYLIQEQSTDYGYANDLKQAILQSLLYGICLQFPREVWNAQYQLTEQDDELVGAIEKRTLEKEGIRYFRPHPTRMFWDLGYEVSSFNTDTGCEFAGYWKVIKYGDILDNPMYWNRKAIGYGSRNWLDPSISSNFFNEVYPCQMSVPVPDIDNKNSRENNMVFYASNERDKGVFLTDLFMKLVPARWKMGTYKNPIWVRFVVASDCTVLYAEPCCYSPVTYFGYDANGLNSRNSSLALEVVPFQDMVGNVLSQILLTCKQNLANVNFYDKNLLDREDIDAIKNSGEQLYRSMNFVGFDSMKNNRAQLDVDKAIHQVDFPAKDVTPLFTCINTMLGILERLLQLSSQEAGQSASHQQSAKEVDLISSNTSNRVQYTGTFIDDGIDAWKRQLYDASAAYMDEEVTALVPGDIPDIEEHLEKLGFKTAGIVQGEGKLKIKGSKRAIKLDCLATSGKGPERKNDSQTAQVMMQAVQAVAANQPLAQAIGVKTLLKIIEKAAILAGADKDFKLRPDQQQQLNELQQLAQQIQTAAVKQIEQDVTKPVADEIAKIQQQVATMERVLAKLVSQSTGQPVPPELSTAPSPVPANQPTPNQPPNGQSQPVPMQG